MSLPWIVMGDKTSHGGTVLQGDPVTDIEGKPVARVGDKVSCPKCKGVFPIATGAPDVIVSGKAVARHGDKTTCGASLVSGQVRTYWGAQGGAAGSGASGIAEQRVFDEQVRFTVNGDTAHMTGLPYFVEMKDGRTFSGYLEGKGELSRIDTAKPDSYAVYWGDEALERMQA